MNTSCSTRTIRYLMFSFNLVFVITGIILIAVGASVHSKYNDYNVFLDGKYFSLPNLLIATGALIFFISFLGCYGAYKESWLMLMAFSILLGVIFVFEFSAGIAGYVLRDKTVSYLENRLTATLPNYTDKGDICSMWDLIQEEFQCCGVNNPTDWTKILNQENDLPISCCQMQKGVIGTFRCNVNVVAPSTVAPDTTQVSTLNSTIASTTSISPSTEPTEITTVSSTDSSTGTSTSDTQTPDKENTILPKTPEPKALISMDDPNASTSPPYDKGCKDAFGDWVKSHAVHIGVVGFIFAILQVAGIGFACHLSRQLKNRYYST